MQNYQGPDWLILFIQMHHVTVVLNDPYCHKIGLMTLPAVFNYSAIIRWCI